jgi:hemolysin III
MTSLARPPDEWANCTTHGVGFLLSLPAAGYLLARVAGQSAALVAACSLYSAALLLVYGTSTLSHLFYDSTWRRRLRACDQACIFLLITGTYTPFAVMYLNHGVWWWLLAGMWVLSALGICRVVQICDLSRTDKLAYGLLGLLPLIALGELTRSAPGGVPAGIVAGGVCYLGGAIFLRQSASVRYAHAAWHLLVIAGSACHYWALLLAINDRSALLK